MRRIAADLAAGFGLLTRLPVGWLVWGAVPWRPGRAVWTYPLAGLLVGAVSGLGLVAARRAGVAGLPAAAWAVAVAALLTGGLHEDGLADTADGLGGGRSRERRLEIMRDSRIGSYGALALGLSLAVRVGAVAALPAGRAVAAMAAAGMLARAAMLPVLLLPPARADGLSRGLGAVSRPALLIGVALGAGLAAALLGVAAGLGAWLAAGLVAAVVAGLAWRRIGGQTGDVLGAVAVSAECVVLSLLAR